MSEPSQEFRDPNPEDSASARLVLLHRLLNDVGRLGDPDQLERGMAKFDKALEQRRGFATASEGNDFNAVLNRLNQKPLRIDEEAITYSINPKTKSAHFYSTPSPYALAINQGARIAQAVNNITMAEDKHRKLVNEKASYIVIDDSGKVRSPDDGGDATAVVNKVLDYLTSHHSDVLEVSIAEAHKSITFDDVFTDGKIDPTKFNTLEEHARRIIFENILKAFYRLGKFPIKIEGVPAFDNRDKNDLEELYRQGVAS